MQSNVRGRPDTQDLIRAYKARFGDRPVPESDEEMREALGWDESMDRLRRDERLASVPSFFDVYETPECRDDRIRRTRAGLAELLSGDPEEHRVSLEILKAALDDDCAPGSSTSTS